MTTFTKTFRKFAPYGLSIFILAPVIAFADNNFVPLTNLPGIADAGGAPSLPFFLNNLYKICIGAAAVIAVLQIMRAGVLLMTSAGSVSSNEQAKGLIQNSVLGLVLVLSPAIVFGIINPKILNLNLDVSGLQSTPKSTTDTVVPQDNTYIDDQPGAQVRCADKGGRAVAGSSGTYICTLPVGSCPVFSVGSSTTQIVGDSLISCCSKQSGCIARVSTKKTYCECTASTN